MEDNMQLPELRKLAKDNGIKNVSKLKKSELIELLQDIKEDKPLEEKLEKSTYEEEEKEEFVSRKPVYIK